MKNKLIFFFIYFNIQQQQKIFNIKKETEVFYIKNNYL